MFEWLISLLIVVVLLIKILDDHRDRLTAFCRGFRQGFAGEIKPDRANLVDGGRIDAAQVARDIERGVRVVAVHHIQSQ